MDINLILIVNCDLSIVTNGAFITNSYDAQ